MQVSNNKNYVAFLEGKKERQGHEISHLFVMQIIKKNNIYGLKLLNKIDMKSMGYSKVCSTFYFNNKNNDELLFADSSKIVSFNFISQTHCVFFDFKGDFTEPPAFFAFNSDQTRCVVSTEQESLLIILTTH